MTREGSEWTFAAVVCCDNVLLVLYINGASHFCEWLSKFMVYSQCSQKHDIIHTSIFVFSLSHCYTMLHSCYIVFRAPEKTQCVHIHALGPWIHPLYFYYVHKVVVIGFECPVHHTGSPQDSQTQVLSKHTFLNSSQIYINPRQVSLQNQSLRKCKTYIHKFSKS